YVVVMLSSMTIPDSYLLSLHDALPILRGHGFGQRLQRPVGHPPHRYVGSLKQLGQPVGRGRHRVQLGDDTRGERFADRLGSLSRSEEHTSELQSRENLVCRLLLEKKKI